ncbi:MAG: hypothetical protein DMG04_31070 [Acidobacteria bacterium]|nr:MAG: hypothetical protein DMG04_31070 [Acidobacteriota bacterium]PYQ92460.1 MAG: hypothetical protein DMG02_01370 [Acidobacteriota bacterium]PYR04491.1 MAG: hypothetical protein DMF99_31875 [Acidobacteriota bacterium]
MGLARHPHFDARALTGRDSMASVPPINRTRSLMTLCIAVRSGRGSLPCECASRQLAIVAAIARSELSGARPVRFGQGGPGKSPSPPSSIGSANRVSTGV